MDRDDADALLDDRHTTLNLLEEAGDAALTGAIPHYCELKS
ncbi:hypothetical protein [Halorussus salinisoli]|nr:hypothetical protein [Halorussus salinisoli]